MTDEQEEEPSADLGQWNDKTFRYPKKGTSISVTRYDPEIWLGHTPVPESEQEVTTEYKNIMRDSQQRKRRLEVGKWLDKVRPDDSENMIKQVFIDTIEPLPFEEFYDDVEDTEEGNAMFEALDMAASVLNEGGACLECDVEPNDEKFVDHKVGCRLVAFMLWRAFHPEGPDRAPSMEMVVKAAKEQIARMQ